LCASLSAADVAAVVVVPVAEAERLVDHTAEAGWVVHRLDRGRAEFLVAVQPHNVLMAMPAVVVLAAGFNPTR
jgi:hypothetical protein